MKPEKRGPQAMQPGGTRFSFDPAYGPDILAVPLRIVVVEVEMILPGWTYPAARIPKNRVGHRLFNFSPPPRFSCS